MSNNPYWLLFLRVCHLLYRLPPPLDVGIDFRSGYAIRTRCVFCIHPYHEGRNRWTDSWSRYIDFKHSHQNQSVNLRAVVGWGSCAVRCHTNGVCSCVKTWCPQRILFDNKKMEYGWIDWKQVWWDYFIYNTKILLANSLRNRRFFFTYKDLGLLSWWL